MHSAGLELTKLTYTRLEDNLMRHRGDRLCWVDALMRFDKKKKKKTKTKTALIPP